VDEQPPAVGEGRTAVLTGLHHVLGHQLASALERVPTRSPAEPSTEPFATGTYNNLDTGESGTFEFVLDPNLSMQLPEVTDCIN